MERIAIFGTGLIGASVGLALRSSGFSGTIAGWDPSDVQLHTALSRGAITVRADDPAIAAAGSDLIVLSGPVFSILENLDRLAPILREDQLVTDVGSVKGAICAHARGKYNGPGQPAFLPGHPMSGKEVSGAANADANLFRDAIWLFTPCGETEEPSTALLSSRPEDAAAPAAERPASSPQPPSSAPALAQQWRAWVAQFGARIVDLSPQRHDVLCAWVSHLPQMVSTALAALLHDEFAANPDLLPIGGRALREMTRLGASPFSMWRDIAHTNSAAIAGSLHALEQRLAHLRENLKTPELRDEFERANQFRPNGSGS